MNEKCSYMFCGVYRDDMYIYFFRNFYMAEKDSSVLFCVYRTEKYSYVFW
jgi:hypothetical protein